MFDEIRQLSSEEMQALWTRGLSKGDSFVLGKKEYKVTVYTDKTFRIKNTKGVNFTFKIYHNGFFIEGKQANLLRGAEGEIRRDLLNEYNSFHICSDVFKLTVQALKNE